MSFLSKATGWIRALLVTVASLALFVLMTLMFSDVVLRSLFNTPIEAATELTRILMAIVVFSVLPVVSTSQGQIVVDLLDGLYTRPGLVRVRDVVVSLVCGLALIEPTHRIWILAGRARSYGETTEYLNIPTFVLGAFIGISVAVTAAALVLHALSLVFVPYRETGSVS